MMVVIVVVVVGDFSVVVAGFCVVSFVVVVGAAVVVVEVDSAVETGLSVVLKLASVLALTSHSMPFPELLLEP